MKKKNIDPAPRSTIPTSRKIIFILVILSALSGLIEFGAKVIYNKRYDKNADKMMRAFMGLGGTYDPNMVSNYAPHPYMVYTLNPNTKWYYEDYFGVKPIQMINSLGFRGKEFSHDKPKGTFRIVCMGGSTTFGLGEPDEEKTYPSLLEKKLSALYPRRQIEVINAGTPGWSSAESLINLQFRVLDLNPDMIVIYDGINDTFAMRKPNEGGSDYSGFRQIVDYKMPEEWYRTVLSKSYLARLLYVQSHHLAFDINGLAVKPAPAGFDEISQLNIASGKYFRRNVRLMVTIAKSFGVNPLLVTMGHGPWHPSLGLTCEIIREISREAKTGLVDFERMSQPGFFDGDRVHLLRPGNDALSSAIAEGIQKGNYITQQ